jgi:hypothetical protein
MMKKLRPWVIAIGILAVIAVICANIYDSVLEKEDLKDEPAWVEPDTTAVETPVND